MRASDRLCEDALTIWRAGVSAVDSERLVKQVVSCTATRLTICGHEFPINRLRRVVVVGAGKAGAGMAAGLEQAVGPDFLNQKVQGWINVPADCVRRLQRIHLHAARPAGVNEPTPEGVAGSMRILQLVDELGPDDLCVVLLSGGGSALLPAPVDPLSLEDKQAVTRFLMQAGATIHELNCVRKQLSRIKGGNLARSTRAGRLLTLIISDVVGDPLDVIASGPTVADETTAADALEILHRFSNASAAIPPAVWTYLEQQAASSPVAPELPPTVFNHVIGNNAAAVSAAADKASELGYQVHSLGSDNQGEARENGRALAELCLGIRDAGRPLGAPACVLSGGEPVVHLAITDRPRKGGRNQELVLAGLERLWDETPDRIVLLSGGTDGEDGPTDAAGAYVDRTVLERARELGLAPQEFLSINNSYPFFEQTGGLLKTGPTHTNVMDLRVGLVGK
jgi:glycerate 2-kinase